MTAPWSQNSALLHCYNLTAVLIWTKFTENILTCCCDITIVYCEQERYTLTVLQSCYKSAINKLSTAVLNCNDSNCEVVLDLLLLHTSQQMYLVSGNPLLHSLEHPTIISLHALVFEQLCHLVGILQGAVTGEVCCYTLKHNLYSDPSPQSFGTFNKNILQTSTSDDSLP